MMITRSNRHAEEQRLLTLFRSLDPSQQMTLLRFAEFLATRSEDAAPQPIQEPRSIPRPEKESVVAAIKRLSQTYPMLDRSRLLTEASQLMGSHILHGRETRLVIDDLEALFASHYSDYRSRHGN